MTDTPHEAAASEPKVLHEFGFNNVWQVVAENVPVGQPRSVWFRSSGQDHEEFYDEAPAHEIARLAALTQQQAADLAYAEGIANGFANELANSKARIAELEADKEAIFATLRYNQDRIAELERALVLSADILRSDTMLTEADEVFMLKQIAAARRAITAKEGGEG